MMVKTITNAQASWSPGPATHITPRNFPEHPTMSTAEGSMPAPAPRGQRLLRRVGIQARLCIQDPNSALCNLGQNAKRVFYTSCNT